jgi:hypothetical protein
MGVERLADVLRRDLECAQHVQAIPRAAAERSLREGLYDLLLHGHGRVRERLCAPLRLRGVIEPVRDDPPRVAVVGHVVVLVAVEPPFEQLLVDESEDGDARLAVLVRDDVAERLQRVRLVGPEEADAGRLLDTPQHDLPRRLVPVVGLLEHIPVGIATVELRRRAPTLARHGDS